jgi:hypothetical protein
MPQEFGHRHGYSFEERKENRVFPKQTSSIVPMTYVITI